MLKTIIFALIESIAGALLLGLAYRQALKPARRERSSSDRVLKFGWFLPVLSSVSLVALVVAGASLLSVNPAVPRRSVWACAGVAVVGSTMCAYLLVESLGSRVVFNRVTITSHSAWRRPRTICWTDIVNVTYSEWSQCFKLINHRGEFIHVSTLFSGILEFASEIPNLLPRASYQPVMNHPMLAGSHQNADTN